MKQLILSFLAALCALPASAQFTLSGRIEGMPDSLQVAVVNVESREQLPLCQASPADGTFCLTCDSVIRPLLCELRILQRSPKNGRLYTRHAVRFMASPEAMQVADVTWIALQEASEDYRTEQLLHISGGQAQADWQEYLDAVYDLEREARLAGYKEAEVYFATNNNPDSVRKYRKLEQAAQRRLHEARVSFARRHPSSFAANYWMYQELRTDFVYTADELEEMASLVQTCPDTVRVNALNRNLEVALRYALGQRYPDFDLIRTDGTSARLSALIPAEAQFTLLDFWASWCGPCRAAIPRVKELAVQYGSRLGLVSVSVDEKETAWRKAMEEEQMTWAQAWLNKVQVPAAADGYMLTTIPRLVLIDGEGRIVCSTNLPDVIVEYLQNHMKP